MGYGTSGLTKLEYAKYLAACLAYFSHRQRDRVGLVTVDSDIVDFVPQSAKHLNQVLHALDRAQPRGRGSLATPLLKVSESQHRRSILLILSDLYEPAEKIRDALGPLRDAPPTQLSTNLGCDLLGCAVDVVPGVVRQAREVPRRTNGLGTQLFGVLDAPRQDAADQGDEQ